jgi:hypothetical protein
LRKFLELRHKESCLTRAGEDEMLFVLLSRDKAAPMTIRFWASQRIHSGLNQPGDQQIVDALECARTMEQEGTIYKPSPASRESR